MSAERQGSLETGEVLSFAITAGVMLASSLFFPSYYLLFIIFALIDGLTTRFRYETFLTIDRTVYTLAVILLSANALGLDVPLMIIEVVVLIMSMDIIFLLRRIRAQSSSDFSAIIINRFRSYLYSLFPAAVFSIGLTYIGTVAIGASVTPANAILELGLASIAVFAIILLLAARLPENLK